MYTLCLCTFCVVYAGIMGGIKVYGTSVPPSSRFNQREKIKQCFINIIWSWIGANTDYVLKEGVSVFAGCLIELFNNTGWRQKNTPLFDYLPVLGDINLTLLHYFLH